MGSDQHCSNHKISIDKIIPKNDTRLHIFYMHMKRLVLLKRPPMATIFTQATVLKTVFKFITSDNLQFKNV